METGSGCSDITSGAGGDGQDGSQAAAPQWDPAEASGTDTVLLSLFIRFYIPVIHDQVWEQT